MSERKTPGPENPDSPERSAQTPDPVPSKMPGEADLQMDAKTMKAFAHPLRMAMYSQLSHRGSATATQLAKDLGESTGQTSYHLRQLEKHGLVEEDTEKGTGRERWWKNSGFSMRAELVKQDPATMQVARTMLQHQLQERFEILRRWMAGSGEEPVVWTDASVDSTITSTMNAEEMRALRDEVMAVIERHTDASAQRIQESGEAEEDRRVRVYLSVLPLPDLED